MHTRSIFRATNPYDSSDKGHGEHVSGQPTPLMPSTQVFVIVSLQRHGSAGIKFFLWFSDPVSTPLLLSRLLSSLLLFLLPCHCWCMHASFATSHCGWNITASMNRFNSLLQASSQAWTDSATLRTESTLTDSGLYHPMFP